MFLNPGRTLEHHWPYTFATLQVGSLNGSLNGSLSGDLRRAIIRTPTLALFSFYDCSCTLFSFCCCAVHAFATPQPIRAAADFQPLDLGGNLFNVNAMESLASAMEISVIGGKNVAGKIHASYRAA
jgi:hypothetical protein